MVGLHAVCEGGRFGAAALEEPAADQAHVHVLSGERLRAFALEVKIQRGPVDGVQVRAAGPAGSRSLHVGSFVGSFFAL